MSRCTWAPRAVVRSCATRCPSPGSKNSDPNLWGSEESALGVKAAGPRKCADLHEIGEGGSSSKKVRLESLPKGQLGRLNRQVVVEEKVMEGPHLAQDRHPPFQPPNFGVSPFFASWLLRQTRPTTWPLRCQRLPCGSARERHGDRHPHQPRHRRQTSGRLRRKLQEIGFTQRPTTSSRSPVRTL